MALNFGQVRSIERFQELFPEEKLDDFIFEKIDKYILCSTYGKYLGNYSINSEDEEPFHKDDFYLDWIETFNYAYKRKVPLKDEETIEDEKLFTSKMDYGCEASGYE